MFREAARERGGDKSRTREKTKKQKNERCIPARLDSIDLPIRGLRIIIIITRYYIDRSSRFDPWLTDGEGRNGEKNGTYETLRRVVHEAELEPLLIEETLGERAAQRVGRQCALLRELQLREQLLKHKTMRRGFNECGRVESSPRRGEIPRYVTRRRGRIYSTHRERD